MRKSIDVADAAAKASGARIVHTCGFDSIPSDLSVFLLHEHAEATGQGELEDTTFVVKSMRGGASGGTIDSMRGQLDEARADKASRKVMLDPYRSQPGSRRRAGPGNARPDGRRARRRAGRLARPVRDGHRQHPRGAPQQRAAGPRLRPQAALPRADARRRAAARAGQGGGDRRRRWRARRRPVVRADPQAAGPCAAGPGGGAQRGGPGEGVLPHRRAHPHEHRRPARLPHHRLRRPGVQGDRRHARPGRAGPGPG